MAKDSTLAMLGAAIGGAIVGGMIILNNDELRTEAERQAKTFFKLTRRLLTRYKSTVDTVAPYQGGLDEGAEAEWDAAIKGIKKTQSNEA